MRIPKGVSPKMLGERRFPTIKLPRAWEKFLGEPSTNFNATIFGGEGQGKSTFCLKLADMLQDYGKVAYFPTEEKLCRSLQERVAVNEIRTKRLLFYPTSDLEVIVETVRRARPRFVIIDSANDCGLDSSALQELKGEFRNRKAWITVLQSPFRAGTKFGYNGDINISVEKGVAWTKKNRFGKLASYNVLPMRNQVPTLFDHEADE